MNAEKRVGTTVPRLAIMVFAGTLGCSGFAADVASWWWHFNGAPGSRNTSYPSDDGTKNIGFRSSGIDVPQCQTASKGEVAFTLDATSAADMKSSLGSVPLFAAKTGGSGTAGGYFEVGDVWNDLLPKVDGKMPSFTIEMVVKYDRPENLQISSKWLACMWSDTFSFGCEWYAWGATWPYGWTLKGNGGVSEGMEGSGLLGFDGLWHHVALVYDAENKVVSAYKDYAQVKQKAIASPYTDSLWHLDIGRGNGDTYLPLTIDELKLTRGALGPDAFFRTAKAAPADFRFRMDPSTTGAFTPVDERGNITVTASGLVVARNEPGVFVSDGQTSRFASYATTFSNSSFALDGNTLVLLGGSAFTLEACLKTSSAADMKIFERGSECSLGLADGAVVWKHGDVEETFAAPVADGAWHSVALEYVPGEGTASYAVFVDGASVGEIADTAPLKLISSDGLSFGAGFAGSVIDLRATPSALAAGELLRVSPDDPLDGSYAYWTFDRGAVVGEKVVSVAAENGDAQFLFKGCSVSSGGGFSEGGDDAPVYSSEVPVACIWDAASGKVLNPENDTSIRFTRVGDGKQGSALRAADARSLPKVFTVEAFLRTVKSAPYTTVFAQRGCDWQWGFGSNNPAWTWKVRLDLSPYPDGYNRGPLFDTSASSPYPNWSHVAFVVDQSVDGKTTVKQYWNYGTPAVTTFNFGRATRTDAVLYMGANGDTAFDGFVDEPRITAGELRPEQFMRGFVPREDLTDVWFVSGADGHEASLPETSWLTATFDPADIVNDLEIPFKGAAFKVGRRWINAPGSVRFNGGAGAVIPCAAVTGTKDFTMEATVKGVVGEIAAKRSRTGKSWSFGIKSDGRAYVSINGTETVSEAGVVNPDEWTHVALVADRTTDKTATLYVNGTAAATALTDGFRLDGGDLVVGRGMTGKLLGLRFKAGALSPDKFFTARVRPGLYIILK